MSGYRSKYKIKVYSYLEGINQESLRDDEIYNLLDDRFNKTLTTNIKERLNESDLPWAKALSNLNIGNYLLAHKKDVLIREDLKEYQSIKNNYDGVLFLDFNKVTKDIEFFYDFIEDCICNNYIGSFTFKDGLGLHHQDIKLFKSRQELCNAFIFVPNSRIDEFTSLFTLGLESGARYIVNCYKDDKQRMSMMTLSYKLNKSNCTENNEQLINSVAFKKFVDEQGIDYGILQRVNHNKIIGIKNSLPNVLMIMIGAEYVKSPNGTTKIQGNNKFRFLRNAIEHVDPWNYEVSDNKRVTQSEFQKNYRYLKKSIENLDELSDKIGKQFINDLEESYAT